MSTALYWLAEFLGFAQNVMLPFTPRFIPAILPNLAHPSNAMQQQAVRTNQALINAIQSLPSPSPSHQNSMDKDKASISSGRTGPQAVSPPVTNGTSPAASRQPTLAREQSVVGEAHPDVTASPASDRTVQMSPRQRAATVPRLKDIPDPPFVPLTESDAISVSQASRSQSPTSTAASVAVSGPAQTGSQVQGQVITQSPTQTESDPFDYHEMVNVLTVQFLSEHEETRVAALKWLIMLHQKVPKKVRSPLLLI